MDRPKRYVPKLLQKDKRPRRKLRPMFVIAVEGKPGELDGAIEGPFPELQEALEVVPEHESACIVLVSEGDDEILYRWDGDCWLSTGD